MEDAQWAERYGWTPDQLDEVDRHRVRKWLAVEAVAREANKFVRQQTDGIQSTMQAWDRKPN